jgi:hypothetical protein
MFDKIYKFSKLAAVLCVIPITFYLCVFLHSLTATTNQLAITAKVLPTQVDGRIGKLQKDVLDKIDTVQGSLNTEVNTLAHLIDTRMDKFTTTTDNRLGALETDTFKAVGDIRETANTQLTTANNSVTTLVTAYAEIPKVVGARYERDFNSYFDCKINKLCLTGQASDMLFAMRQTSRQIEKASDDFDAALPIILTNVKLITTKFQDTEDQSQSLMRESAGMMANMRKATTPLPTWLRIVLGVGPPVAQGGAAVVAAGSVLGWFK